MICISQDSQSLIYCGWLRNPAPPKGWLKPINHGINHRFQLVIRISLAHPPGTMANWRLAPWSVRPSACCRRSSPSACPFPWARPSAEEQVGRPGDGDQVTGFIVKININPWNPYLRKPPESYWKNINNL